MTIGIGTRNRCASLEVVLDALITANLRSDIEILVVDDASNDTTPDVLTTAANRAGRSLRLIRHDEQRGFAGSLSTLVNHSRGRWLLLTSDDDVLRLDVLPTLLQVLERERPGVLVPAFLDGDRGIMRSKKTGFRIHPGKTWGTLGHVPGVVFDVVEARRHTGLLNSLLEDKNSFAMVYPQVVLGLEMTCSGIDIVHWSEYTASTGDDNPSGIRDANNEPYWAMSSRMRQFFGFQKYLDQRIQETDGTARTRFEEVRQWNRDKLLDFFAAWLTSEYPDHAEAVQKARVPPVRRRDRLLAALRILRTGQT